MSRTRELMSARDSSRTWMCSHIVSSVVVAIAERENAGEDACIRNLLLMAEDDGEGLDRE